MTFLCPICHEISSGKHEKVIPRKKGKTWRERKTERAVMTTVNLGFTCPCCKEVREMGTHNPFDNFKSMGKKKRQVVKTKPKKGKVLIKPKSLPEKTKEVTALSAEALVSSVGASLSDERAMSELRVNSRKSATVSWDDATEMRRLILEDMVIKAATGSAIQFSVLFAAGELE
eukprot:CAMPEP_0185029618 /NCGR_PEP_ID=MMETSP1103-20130426/16034_1 /TAXON_ID=36769 /ORGANISM="Paraphysomonas bandaiensis, Strain Caron Lab Isolate" /LENGTH=172 /DNA_ID=CAMNT_0027564429 /DNA_START=114 /DNA_END=633 /DNA_ORIENTATION=+